jgi:hypothetical protein
MQQLIYLFIYLFNVRQVQQPMFVDKNGGTCAGSKPIKYIVYPSILPFSVRGEPLVRLLAWYRFWPLTKNGHRFRIARLHSHTPK